MRHAILELIARPRGDARIAESGSATSSGVNYRGDEQAHISVPDAYLRPGGHLLGVSLEERQETTSSPAHFLYQVSGSGGAETIIGPAQSAH